MNELAMAPFLISQDPAISPKEFQHIANLHGLVVRVPPEHSHGS